MTKNMYTWTVAAFLASSGASLSAQTTSPMHQMQQMHPNSLTRNQRAILHRLSPKYQHIYLYVLTEDEKEDVVMMYQRGDNPYRVINTILCKESKDYRKQRRHSMRKSERAYAFVPTEGEDEYGYEEEVSSPVKRKYRQENAHYSSSQKTEKKQAREEKGSSGGMMQKCRNLYSSCLKPSTKKVKHSTKQANPCKSCRRKQCGH